MPVSQAKGSRPCMTRFSDSLRDAMTGILQAIASKIVVLIPSASEGCIKAKEPRINGITSFLKQLAATPL